MKYKFNFFPADQIKFNSLPFAENTLQLINDYFRNHFGKKYGVVTNNGREAMSLLFKHLGLKKEDEIFITTTFDYPNVSSCVTCTVFNYCKPSRVMTNHTKAIFVIHEFGVMHPELENLRLIANDRKIPLIEDCAHTFLSKNQSGVTSGSIGDWVIISFPKFYPVNNGGMLLGNEIFNTETKCNTTILDDMSIVFHELPFNFDYAKKRIEISHLLLKGICQNRIQPLLKENDFESVPWFFPIEVDQPEEYILKLRSMGIESGLWHGSNVIVIPLHQYFTNGDIKEAVSIFNKINNGSGKKF